MKSDAIKPSDEQLTDAIRQADPEAYRQLYYRYFESIVRFIQYKTGDCEQAYDLAQDVFANLWINRKRLDPTRSIKSYIYRAASNRVIDSQRKMAREAGSSAHAPSVQTEIQPDESFELADRIDYAVAALPEPV